MRLITFIFLLSLGSLNAQGPVSTDVSVIPFQIVGAGADTLTTFDLIVTHGQGAVSIIREQVSGTNELITVKMEASLDRVLWFPLHFSDITGMIRVDGLAAFDDGPFFIWDNSGLGTQGQMHYNFTQIFYHFRMIITQQGTGTSSYIIAIAYKQ